MILISCILYTYYIPIAKFQEKNKFRPQCVFMSCIESYLRNLYSFDWIGLDMGQLEHRNLASIGTQLPQSIGILPALGRNCPNWHGTLTPPSCECNDESEEFEGPIFQKTPDWPHITSPFIDHFPTKTHQITGDFLLPDWSTGGNYHTRAMCSPIRTSLFLSSRRNLPLNHQFHLQRWDFNTHPLVIKHGWKNTVKMEL